MPARVTRWSRDGLLCRAYLCVSLGLLQPFFLLLALLLCRSALRRAATPCVQASCRVRVHKTCRMLSLYRADLQQVPALPALL